MQTTYSSLLAPLIALLSSALTQLTARVKQALQRHTFLALAAYSRLSNPVNQQRWDEVITRRSGRTAGPGNIGQQAKKQESLNVNALREGLHSLRAVCLRSFPEFLADIKVAGMPSALGEIGIGIAPITETVRLSLRAFQVRMFI